jgi:hypothetical protein
MEQKLNTILIKYKCFFLLLIIIRLLEINVGIQKIREKQLLMNRANIVGIFGFNRFNKKNVILISKADRIANVAACIYMLDLKFIFVMHQKEYIRLLILELIN